ncbi:hypothetical protein [Rubrolithibacter danxiaensis]|uniref:hypothetical protein n=1 Tax=Rubrolithibacter danxiaensis TaxID=3390805 RepID=UPI003BF8EA3A
MVISNKKNRNAIGQKDVQDKIEGSILRECMRMQAGWAAWMQRKTERLSVKVKVVMLLLFCFFASTYSIYLISDSLLGKYTLSFEIASIKKPGYAQLPGDENTKASIVINEDAYQKIHHFKAYLDNLSNSPLGKERYDSIVKHNPDLMDSIKLIENIYQSQNKN